MASVAAATRHTYVDRESLNHALTSDLVGWTVSETREAPLLTHVVPHRLGDIRLLELSGNPLGAVRGRLCSHIQESVQGRACDLRPVFLTWAHEKSPTRQNWHNRRLGAWHSWGSTT